MRRGFFVCGEPLAKLFVWVAGVGFYGRTGPPRSFLQEPHVFESFQLVT